MSKYVAGTKNQMRRSLPYLAILVFVAIILSPCIFLGRAFYWGDILLYFLPAEEFVQSSLKSGRFPLWNPYVLCGQPFVGNPQSWVFYPTTALLYFLTASKALALNSGIHLVIAGWGIFTLFRKMGLDRISSLLGATLYAGSGFILARLQFPTMVMSYAWAPWLITLGYSLIDKPSARRISLFAIVTALEILSGHTQIAYMSFGLLFILSAVRVIKSEGTLSNKRRSAGAVLIGFVLGISLSAIQLLPIFQLIGLSTREKLTYWQANRFILHPADLLNFINPLHAGTPTHGNFAGEGNFWEPYVYLGVLSILLAGIAIFSKSTRHQVRLWSIICLTSLALAMGKFTPLFWLAFRIVPGVSAFHDPARFTFLTTFGLCVLSAIALHNFGSKGMSSRRRGIIATICLCDLVLYNGRVTPTLSESELAYRPRIMQQTPTRGEGRVFTVHRESVWDKYLNYTDYGPLSPRYVHELTDTLSPNIGMRYGVEEGSGYEPVPLRAITEVDSLVRTGFERHSLSLINLLGLFNTDSILLPQNSRYVYSGLTPEHARGLATLDVDNNRPRAWFVRTSRRIDGSSRVLNALSDPNFDLSEEAIISGSNGLPIASPKNIDGHVQLISQSRTEWKYFVSQLKSDAFLVWSNSFYPGWRADIDGRDVLIERANHAFCGLVVPAGSQVVTFKYLPSTFRVGEFISLMTALILAAMFSSGIIKRRI